MSPPKLNGGFQVLPPSRLARHADAEDIDDVRVVRIDDDLAVVIAGIAPDGLLLRTDLGPGRPGVRGTVDLAVDHAGAGLAGQDLVPAVLRGHPGLVGVLDHRVDDLRVLGRNGQADPSEDARGQAAGELGPGLAAVDRLVDPRTGTAEPEGPGPPEPVVGRGIERVRRNRVHDQVDGADRPAVDGDVQDLGPGLAAVRGLVDPALGIFGIEMAQGGHVDHAGVGRMDDDAPDVVGFLQTRILPGLAAVDGLVDAVAPIGRTGVVGLAGAEPEGVGSGRGHGDVADREDLLPVEERLEGLSVVLRLPQPARSGRGVKSVRPPGRNGEVDEPAALLGRTYGAEIQAVQDGRGLDRRGRRLFCGLGLGREAGREGREQDGQGQERDRQLAGHGESPCPDQRSVLR